MAGARQTRWESQIQGLPSELVDWLEEGEALPPESPPQAEAVATVGPGLLALALQGMEAGAVGAGLSPEVARPLARQTLLGTSLLLQDEAGSPAELKDRVASPGGMTIAGLAVLEERAVRGAYLRAMEQVCREWKPRPGPELDKGLA